MIKACACPSALVLSLLNRYQVQPQSVLSAVIQTFFAKPATSKRSSVIAPATIRVAAAARFRALLRQGGAGYQNPGTIMDTWHSMKQNPLNVYHNNEKCLPGTQIAP